MTLQELFRKEKSNNSGSHDGAAKVAISNGSRPGVDEIRTRAYEIFQSRHGATGSAIGDWQKAEASIIADANERATSRTNVSEKATAPADAETIQEAIAKFHSSIEHGLTEEEAASRLKKDGPNAIAERRISPLKRFLTFLWGPIPWMIEIAAILSALVRH
jgi:hypothetical protein